MSVEASEDVVVRPLRITQQNACQRIEDAVDTINDQWQDWHEAALEQEREDQDEGTYQECIDWAVRTVLDGMVFDEPLTMPMSEDAKPSIRMVSVFGVCELTVSDGRRELTLQINPEGVRKMIDELKAVAESTV